METRCSIQLEMVKKEEEAYQHYLVAFVRVLVCGAGLLSKLLVAALVAYGEEEEAVENVIVICAVCNGEEEGGHGREGHQVVLFSL